MTVKDLIHLISKREEIVNQPPVLLDLGASGALNPVWEPISKFCIGVAFDADNRKFGYVEKESSAFKKMYVYNSIVTAQENVDTIPFYLTDSPYCSSTLRPLTEKLTPFHFSDLFETKEIVELNAKNIGQAFDKMGIKQVDWFKTDTQGTDLRLFKSLPQSFQESCTVVQFEPGVIDVYEGEDKLHHVLAYMDALPMRLYECTVLGSINIPHQDFVQFFPDKVRKKLAVNILKTTPGWAEISYIKKFDSDKVTTRDFLLGWLFMMMEKQYPTAYYIAKLATKKYPADDLLKKLFDYSTKRIKKEIFRPRNWKHILSTVKSKLIG